MSLFGNNRGAALLAGHVEVFPGSENLGAKLFRFSFSLEPVLKKTRRQPVKKLNCLVDKLFGIDKAYETNSEVSLDNAQKSPTSEQKLNRITIIVLSLRGEGEGAQNVSGKNEQ